MKAPWLRASSVASNGIAGKWGVREGRDCVAGLGLPVPSRRLERDSRRQPLAWVGVAHAISPDVRYGILPSLTPRKLRFGILPALACEAGEMTRATPPPDR